MILQENKMIVNFKKKSEFLWYKLSKRIYKLPKGTIWSIYLPKNDSLKLTRVHRAIYSYQFLNELSEKAYLNSDMLSSKYFREASLLKRLGISSNQIIEKLKITEDFIDSNLEYISFTGIENLGFILSAKNNYKKKILKIHDYKAMWNHELFFYTKVVSSYDKLTDIVSNAKIHSIKIGKKTLNLIEFEYLDFEDIGFLKFKWLERPHLILDSINWSTLDSDLKKLIYLDKIDSKYVYKKFRLVKSSLNYVIKDKNINITLKLNTYQQKILGTIKNISDSDYCLNHGDFDYGGIGGYGNKFISKNKVVFIDWSELKFVLKGLNHIMLLRRHLSPYEILNEIENSRLTANLSRSVKQIIVFNLIVDYVVFFKNSKNMSIINDMVVIMNAY